MRKKILILIIVLMAMAGTAYAANLWGTYKGRQIVQLVVNGTVIKNSVPAQILDQTTMVPLRVVSEALGASVSWNSKQQRVTVTTPEELNGAMSYQTGLSLKQLNEIGRSVGMIQALDSVGKPMWAGSGFILNGMLITNYHVVKDSVSLKVTFGIKEKIIPSTYLFTNEEKDLAALKFEGYPSLKLNTAEPKKGDPVYVLGFPDKRFTINEGKILFFTLRNEITHDAATDGGSSGGILIDASGQVIGVSVGNMDGTIYNSAIKAKYLQEELNKL